MCKILQAFFFLLFFQAVILPTRQQTTTAHWSTDIQTDTNIQNRYKETEREKRRGRKAEDQKQIERHACRQVNSWKMAVELYKRGTQLEIIQSTKIWSVNCNIHRNIFGFLLLVYSFIEIIIKKKKKAIKWPKLKQCLSRCHQVYACFLINKPVVLFCFFVFLANGSWDNHNYVSESAKYVAMFPPTKVKWSSCHITSRNQMILTTDRVNEKKILLPKGLIPTLNYRLCTSCKSSPPNNCSINKWICAIV